MTDVYFHLDGFFQLYIFKVATVRYIVVKVEIMNRPPLKRFPRPAAPLSFHAGETKGLRKVTDNTICFPPGC